MPFVDQVLPRNGGNEQNLLVAYVPHQPHPMRKASPSSVLRVVLSTVNIEPQKHNGRAGNEGVRILERHALADYIGTNAARGETYVIL